MRFAIDKNGERVHIDDTDKSLNYFCPCCKGKLILKMGMIRAHHFAHEPNFVCNDFWNYDISDWHISWQSLFPKDCQEIVKEIKGIRHRADVLLEKEKVVFEFQHDALSSFEFDNRNEFYNTLGYKVIWIFDVEELYCSGAIENYKSNLWKWKKAKKTFSNYNYKNKLVEILLQINNKDPKLIKVTWVSEEGIANFATNGVLYNEQSIIHMFDKKKDKYSMQELYDKLIFLYEKRCIKYFFGCPISSTHVCTPVDDFINDDPSISSCKGCPYRVFEGNINEEIYCKERFSDIEINNNTQIEVISRDGNDFVDKISFYENNKKQYLSIPTYKTDKINTIPALWNGENISWITFKNTKKDLYVKIIRDPNAQFTKYNRIYGFISNDKFNFQGDSIEIYNATKKEWTIDYIKTKQ